MSGIQVSESDDIERSHEERLAEVNEWEFHVDGGKTFANGKSYWPDYLTLRIPRDRALRLMEELTKQLAQPLEADTVVLHEFGHLFRDVND